MSASMDRAMMALSMEEEEVPFDMPDLPDYCSSEDNVQSIIGRVLNPDCQKMASLILDMPRKWQLYDRVRGIALSKERKGIHTYNEWALAIDRWIEKSPADYLQFIPVWIQLHQIPVNHYTTKAITALGDLVGKVIEVAFDPKRSQSLGFVRVRVLFDVSRPIRLSKVVNLPGGGSATVLYDFERIQKRCYSCQRLTHQQDSCPLKLLKKQSKILPNKGFAALSLSPGELFLKDGDPLFGVIEEKHVGLNPATGRPKIASEVLDGMRQYLLVANGDERVIREARIRSSLASIEGDLFAQKSMLSLEPIPHVSKDLHKDKGIVFDYSKQIMSQGEPEMRRGESKLMGSAIAAGSTRSYYLNLNFDGVSADYLGLSQVSQGRPTVFSSPFSGASSSGANLLKPKTRRRPSKAVRKARAPAAETTLKGKVIVQARITKKRKVEDETNATLRAAKHIQTEMVPMEGPSNAQ
ncbi:uncharacterized protein LOC112085278 [Eutrema salsugineum]|uniref:uncharacterized protein LOC112085278 n=1 Tax=Eutrema salsugineum TaxID=72664 RepID=UPI000CED5B49|nr:uncharacterized protein LOC112085278 [Eutrema salsugineum]